MPDRVCVRGCTLLGRHLVPHGVDERCKGCLPVEAMVGAMLCERCVDRLRRTLSDAPHLCAHLRSMVDPSRSGWNFDRVKLSSQRAGSKLPMNADLIEAADETLAILTYFAELFGDEMDYSKRHTFDAGADPTSAYHVARMPVGFLLENLGWIVNDHRVEEFVRAVLGPNADPEDWTIARALARWPMKDRARFAEEPCPECGFLTVLVMPPRHPGDRRAYECRNPKCGWVPPEVEFQLWEDRFDGEEIA